jgi:hypothetical protein
MDTEQLFPPSLPTPTRTVYLVRKVVDDTYYVGAASGWHRDPKWAFECETLPDALNLIAVLPEAQYVVDIFYR